MSVQETQQAMQGYLDALLERRDIAPFFAADVLWTTMENGDEVRGRDAVRDFIVNFHTKMFDARPQLRKLLVGDQEAFIEATFVGTHIGEFADVPATGAKVHVPYCIAYDFDGDKITALRAYLSVTALVEQIRAAA